MASFFSKLFGGQKRQNTSSPRLGEPVPYEGLIIQAGPVPVDGQWRLAGLITKRAADGDLRRNFLRADLFASKEEADAFSIRKGQQIIDEQKDRLFAGGEPEGRA